MHWVRPYTKADGTHVRGHWRRGSGRSTQTTETSHTIPVAGLILVAFLLLGGIGAVAAFASGALGSIASSGPPSSKQVDRKPEKKPPRQTSPVRDGGIQFAVKAARLLGAEDDEKEKKLVVTVSSKNLTKSWIAFFGEDQVTISTAKELRHGVSAAFMLGPEQTVTVKLEFSLPPQFVPLKLELHYEPDSKGVKIDLTIETSE